MSTTPKLALWTVIVTAAAALAWPASGDVLVTKDGGTIETDGPWEVRGRLVRFALPDGTLGSIRLSEVDLEASDRATAEAANPAPPPPPPSRKAPTEPVLVVTDADIPRGSDAFEEDEAGEAEAQPVAVTRWSWDPASADGELGVWELTGTVANRGDREVYDLEVYFDAIAVGDDGQPQPEVNLLRQAMVDENRLEPGASTDFRYVVTVRDLGDNPAQFASPRVSFDLRFRQEGGGEESATEEAEGDAEDFAGSSESANAG